VRKGGYQDAVQTLTLTGPATVLDVELAPSR
jgi:hypothetical protein